MTKTTEDQPEKSLFKRHGLVWKLLIAAFAGAATIVGIKAGWAKLVGWAKGVKPVYNFGETPYFGALGAIFAAAIVHEDEARKPKDQCLNSKPIEQNLLTLPNGGKSFSQNITTTRNATPTSGISRGQF